jgi:glycosyltransferase involved in cell wall biosynthesis
MDRIIFGGQSHWAAKNSPVALAEAIQRTSRLNLAAMGEAASRQVLAGYSWQKVFDRLFAIYRNVISTYRK